MRDLIAKYGTDIQAVWACNDAEALGVVQACKEAGIEDCVIVGADGSTAALQAIYDGEMTFTEKAEVRKNASIATTVLLVAVASGLNGGEQEKTPLVAMDMTYINADNVLEYYDPDAPIA